MAYLTESGLRVPAVTAAEMREVDRIAIDETGPNLFQMMENAGRSLASIVASASGGSRGPVVVLAGSGGNGGGGICAARHLANQGADVVVSLSDEQRLGDVPRQQLEVFNETSGSVVPWPELRVAQPSVVVDALVGYSLRGSPRGVVAEMIGWVNNQVASVISLDVPTGVDSTDGSTAGVHIRPGATMTLALPKTGLIAADVGVLWLADIGIPSGTFRRAGISIPSDLFRREPLVRLSPG